jgi:aspartyl/asparaginyl-tRNA synthetase
MESREAQKSSGVDIGAVTKNLIINPCTFNKVVIKLREFFQNKGFVEVHTQNRLSILAACEDPSTIQTFNYAGLKWPLPQTGQMWLEFEMLKDPSPPGYFCVSTSYRNEANPIPGRHDIIFPMFEFELKGDIEDLIKLEKDLLTHLGYKSECFPEMKYEEAAARYGVKDLEHEHEQKMCEEFGPVFFLRDFPEYTSPFWNMNRYEDSRYSKKVDVIISGMETIGSAERSCDTEQMRNSFNTISDGGYAQLIYDHFGKDRVDKELEEFLTNKFMVRSGGGIGLTRLISSMIKEELI